MLHANKSKEHIISKLVEKLGDGAASICNESTAANIQNSTEIHNLTESVKDLMIDHYGAEFGDHEASMLQEDAEMVASLIKGGISESYASLNENSTPSVATLTTSIAVNIRSPYEAVFHRLYDTQPVDRPIISIETVVPMVVDPNGVTEAIIDAFNPQSPDYFIDRTEIAITALTDGIVPGTKKINLLDGMDPVYTVDKDVRVTGVEANYADGTPADPANVKFKAGTLPYFDAKDFTLSTIFEITQPDGTVVDADVTAKIDFAAGVMEYVRGDEAITKVFFAGVISHEEHTHPIQTTFENSFNEIPVPTRPHIEVSIPIEAKTDIDNSLSYLGRTGIITAMTKQVSILSTRMEDERLKKTMTDRGSMFSAAFDFEPPANFQHGNIEWMKREFIPFLDQCATAMKAEYNLDDVHFRVGVSPYILKILDAEYTKDRSATEDQKGSGELNYSIAVKTSTATFYLISSVAMPLDRLYMNAIINNFKESQIKTYNYFKYSSFVTDQLRKASNTRLAATVYSERNLPVVFTNLSANVELTNMPITKTTGTAYIKKNTP